MLIHAMSRERAVDWEPNTQTAAVSIGTPDHDYPSSIKMIGWADTLYLNFWDIGDIDPDDWLYKARWGDKEPVLFDRHMAIRVVSFVLAYHGKIDDLLIHCDMGISRSVGMATAIKDSIMESEIKLWDVPNERRMNKRVYDTVMMEFLRARGSGS